jgi:ParB family chromosome partitioning protein
VQEFKLTQEQIADEVGKDRSSIANYMRLLKLPEEIRAEIASGTLSMGHARALLALDEGTAQRRAAREVISRGLSVRETEALVRRTLEPPRKSAAKPLDPNTRAAEEKLRFSLGTRVRIVRKGKGGRIEIDFASEEELHRLYEHLAG